MKIAICGISGFIGQEIKNFFHAKGYEIIGVDRSLSSNSNRIKEFSELISTCSIIFNLSGASIIKPWTKKYQKEIYNSRIITTNNIAKAIELASIKPKLFISTSAIGIYKPNKTHSEDLFEYDNSFLTKVCKDWEGAALSVENNTRVVVTRLGIVLDKKGGVVKSLYPLFKLGLGAMLLPSKSSFPFVQLNDLMRAYEFVINKTECSGIFNIVASEKTTQLDFAKAFAKTLKRPLIFFVPSFVLKLFLGTAANIIIKNPFVVSNKLKQLGFVYEYSDIQAAMKKSLLD